MHITLESDYAVRIVYCLAQNGGRMEAAAIAEQTGVTLRFSLKILRKLVAGGLVKSYKGAGGGYELAGGGPVCHQPVPFRGGLYLQPQPADLRGLQI